MTHPVAAILTGDVGENCGGLPCRGSTVCVHHALIRSSAISVDLVDGHLDLTTRGSLRKLVARLGHDGLCAGLEIILTTSKGLADSGSVGALEAGCVLLERIATCAVTRGGGDDAKGHAAAASVTGSLDDGAVTGHEGNECEESCSLHDERRKESVEKVSKEVKKVV